MTRKRPPLQRIEFRWAAKWRQKNRLDGEHEHLILGPGNQWVPFALYDSREACRGAIKADYAYLRQRPDLRAEPHGWKMPVPVRVKITIEEVP